MGWLSGWERRKKQTITGTSVGAQSNYQLKMTVHKGSGTDSATDVYCDGNCRDDFGDIRWTKADGTTLMDYWIESIVSGDNAVFWIEIPAVPANPDTVDIYMSYSNSGETSLSNGHDTFDMFEDFETDLLKWDFYPQTGGSFTQSSAAKKEGVYSGLIMAGNVQDGISYAILKVPVPFGANIRFYFWASTSGNGFSGIYATPNSDRSDGTQIWWSGYDTGGTWDTYTDVPSDWWNKDIYIWMYSGNRYFTNRPTYYDLFIAMRHTTPEPTWGTWEGVELEPLVLLESLTAADTFSREGTFKRVIDEYLALTDTGVFKFARTLTEGLGLVDSMTGFGFMRMLSEYINVRDFLSPLTPDFVRFAEFYVPQGEVRIYDSMEEEKKDVSPLLDIISYRVDNSIQPEADTFTVEIDNKDGKNTDRIVIGDLLTISVGYNQADLRTKIHGPIEDISFKLDDSGETMTLKGKDYVGLFLRKVIDYKYKEKDVKEIITARYTVEGFSGIMERAGLLNDITLNNVEDTDYPVTVNFKDKTVLDCLKELAEIMVSKGAGERWDFYLDTSKDLHFFKTETAPDSTEELIVGENILSCVFARDVSRIANRIKVKGAYTISKKVDTFPVSEGETEYTFVSTYPSIDRILTLTIDAVEKEEGVDYKSNYLAGTISFEGGVTGGGGGSSVVVTYLYKSRIETTGGWKEDAESQSLYGIKEWVVNTDTDNQALIDNLSISLLRYYKDVKKRGTVRALGMEKVNVGELIKVTYIKGGITQEKYKIVKLTHEYSGDSGYTSNVVLEEYVPSLAELLKELFRGQSSLTTRMP